MTTDATFLMPAFRIVPRMFVTGDYTSQEQINRVANEKIAEMHRKREEEDARYPPSRTMCVWCYEKYWSLFNPVILDECPSCGSRELVYYYYLPF